MNVFRQLQSHSKIVADSCELSTFQQYAPLSGVTTNPTLLLRGMEANEFPDLIYEAVTRAKKKSLSIEKQLQEVQDWLLILVADKLKDYVDGRISIEVDARLSFDAEATFHRAEKIITMAESLDIDTDKLLIKIASTWEGIVAARMLEQRNINCNMTLLFDFYQALACAQAQVTLISPFVGRITDWYKNALGSSDVDISNDEGVASVKRIYSYYKANNIHTLVMAASFRSIKQIEALCGCDLLTISPALISQLEQSDRELVGSIENYEAQQEIDYTEKLDEQRFRWLFNENAMATEKLAEGIRVFAQDQVKLEEQLRSMLEA